MNTEALPKVESAPEQDEEELRRQEKERKRREIKEREPKGDPRTVMGRVNVYDKIRFSKTGEAGWHDAEVVGWVDAKRIKVHLMDNGQKTGRIITLHREGIASVDIIEGRYDYLRRKK